MSNDYAMLFCIEVILSELNSIKNTLKTLGRVVK